MAENVGTYSKQLMNNFNMRNTNSIMVSKIIRMFSTMYINTGVLLEADQGFKHSFGICIIKTDIIWMCLEGQWGPLMDMETQDNSVNFKVI